MDNYGVENGTQNGNQFEKPMTLGEWVITLIVLAIPCVGTILLFVWGFGQGNTSRKNYCRAMLIFLAIGIVLSIIFSATLGAIFAGAMDSF